MVYQRNPIADSGGTSSSHQFRSKFGKKRGSYNCGRCGKPKKGHSCQTTEIGALSHLMTSDSFSSFDLSPHGPHTSPRRVLYFEDEIASDSPQSEFQEGCSTDFGPDLDCGGGLTAFCLWEIMRRLAPRELISAAKVCRGWRGTAKKVWRSAEELRLRVPPMAQFGFAGSVLQKCASLVRLSLTMQSDFDSTMLACVAFSCPNLEVLEVYTSGTATNWITGDELGRFVSDKRSLTSFKMEGCSNLGRFSISSFGLSTLWLSDLHSLSMMAFNCPNLREISLDFSHHHNENTDLISMLSGMGKNCRRLQHIHIASLQLSHAAVLALVDANLRDLRMLSLVLGSEINDASVAAIASSYPNLQLLDLSGSSISDSAIGMICNTFAETLRRLLLALCHNVSSSGIQFATAQLPLLEVMDCGMTILDPNSFSHGASDENRDFENPKVYYKKSSQLYTKLIVKHDRLKKFSLWGCSGFDALSLNCPELVDLNLNSCTNLNPDKLLIHCPKLEIVHAAGCEYSLINVITKQVHDDFDATECHFPCKRLADGSKRITAPYVVDGEQLQYGDECNRKHKRMRKEACSVLLE